MLSELFISDRSLADLDHWSCLILLQLLRLYHIS